MILVGVIKLNNIVFQKKLKKFFFRFSEINGTGENVTLKARLVSKEQAKSGKCSKQGFLSDKKCDFFFFENLKGSFCSKSF